LRDLKRSDIRAPVFPSNRSSLPAWYIVVHREESHEPAKEIWMVFEEGLDLRIEYMSIRKGNNKKNNGQSNGGLLRKHLLEDLFAALVVSLIQVQYFQK
jgi:hypothetical protein